MALTVLEATVLGMLGVSKPAAAQTLRQLLNATGNERSGATLRRALRNLSNAGLVQQAGSSPVRWRITSRGQLSISSPKYRDYQLPKAV